MNTCKHDFDLAGDCRICGTTIEQLQNAEVIRLQAEVKELRAKLQLESSAKVSSALDLHERNEIVRLRAENEKLEQLLSQIGAMCEKALE